MFSYEVLQSFNNLEMLVYNYVMEHRHEVQYMTIRELAEAVHVSTSTVVRFCKKAGCDGYSEFRVQFKMFLKEEKEHKSKARMDESVDELTNFFRTVTSTRYEEQMNEYAMHIKAAKQLIFVGIGTSGILGKYGARYFSNLGQVQPVYRRSVLSDRRRPGRCAGDCVVRVRRDAGSDQPGHAL